MAKLLDAARRQ